MITELVPIEAEIYSNSQKRISYGTRKMCIINHRLRDKKPLSQKLIPKTSRFYEFYAAKWCVITYVYETGKLESK